MKLLLVTLLPACLIKAFVVALFRISNTVIAVTLLIEKLITKGLTCGKITTGIRHRLLAVVDGVSLHLVSGAGCQLFDAMLKCIVVHLKGTIKVSGSL